MSSEKTELETQSLLTMLMEDTTGGSELPNLSIKSMHHTNKKAEIATDDVNKPISSPSGVPSGQIRHARYVAPVRKSGFLSLLLMLPLFRYLKHGQFSVCSIQPGVFHSSSMIGILQIFPEDCVNRFEKLTFGRHLTINQKSFHLL